MKRIILAYVIVGIILGLTVVSNIIMSSLMTNFDYQLNEIITLSQEQSQELASKKIHELSLDFKQKRHLLELFVKRDYVLSLNVSIEGLRAYPTKDTWKDLESEAEKAHEQLRSIKHLFFSIV